MPSRGGSLAGIALIDAGQCDGVVDDYLYDTRKPVHLAAILGTGGREVERQQMAQCVDGHVDLGALLGFPTVITSPLAAFGSRTQRPATIIAAIGLALRPAANRSTARESSTSALKHPAASEPCVCWYTPAPGRQVAGHPPPGRTSLHDMAPFVEHLAQAMLLPAGILVLQQKVWRDQQPLRGTDVGRIRLAATVHLIPNEHARFQVHNSPQEASMHPCIRKSMASHRSIKRTTRFIINI